MTMAFSIRVKWIHDCPGDNGCDYDKGGDVWRPHPSRWYGDALLTDYEIAINLGFTADPPPDPDRQYAMVQWDCRRGVLQLHYWNELEEVT